MKYIINFYVVASKYLVPSAQKHAEEDFGKVMGAMTSEAVVFLVNLWPQEEEVLQVFETVAPVLYAGDTGEAVKALRPAFVRAVRSHAAGMVGVEGFKELMVGIPDLAFEVLVALAAGARVWEGDWEEVPDRKQEKGQKKKSRRMSLSPGPPTPPHARFIPGATITQWLGPQ